MTQVFVGEILTKYCRSLLNGQNYNLHRTEKG